MGTRRRDIRATGLGRFVRGRRPDRNPLRRASDRLETAVLPMLVIAFLAAAPFAALAPSSWTLARARQAQLAEQASSYQVPVLVLKLEALSGGAYGDPQSQAQWTAHDGKVITGEIAVPLGTTSGSTQWLWTTRDGQVTDPPLQDSQVTGQAYFAEGSTVFTLAVLLTITGLLGRRTLDRRRMAAWDTEWRATGPPDGVSQAGVQRGQRLVGRRYVGLPIQLQDQRHLAGVVPVELLRETEPAIALALAFSIASYPVPRPGEVREVPGVFASPNRTFASTHLPRWLPA